MPPRAYLYAVPYGLYEQYKVRLRFPWDEPSLRC